MRRLFSILLCVMLAVRPSFADTTVATDAFTYGDQLMTATGNWSASGTATTIAIASNQVSMPFAGADNGVVWSGASFNNDQWAQITLVGASTASKFGGLLLRAGTGATRNYYYFLCSSTLCKAGKYVSNTHTAIQTAVAHNQTLPITMKATVSGTTLKFYVNGSIAAGFSSSYTDSSQTAGKAGVFSQNSSGSPAVTMDDWSAGNLAVTLATPTISPNTGTYSSTQTGSISGPGGATVCYTTTGVAPTTDGNGSCTSGTTYSSTFTVGTVGAVSTTTVKAVATQSGFNDSAVASNDITVQYALASIAVAGGSYFARRYVETSCTPSTGTGYYTTDNTTPTTGSTQYGGTYSPTISTVTNTGSGSLSQQPYYKITSTNATGESLPSAEVAGPPNGSFTAQISWSAVTRATGYKIYRSYATGTEQYVGTTASTSYSDDGTVTPSGALPTYNSSGAIDTGTSGTKTIQVLCTASSYGDSTIASNTYIIAPADVAIASEDFSAYFDSHYSGSSDHVLQFPLDTISTGGKWKANSALTGDMGTDWQSPGIGIVTHPDCTPVVSGKCITGIASGAYRSVTYTGRTGFSNDQFAKAYLPDSLGQAGVCVRCSTSGTNSGYYLRVSVGSGNAAILLAKVLSGSETVLASVSNGTVSSNSTVELRVAGTSLQLLINDSVPSGFATDYTDSGISSGNPGAITYGGHLSDWSAGNVGASDSTSTYTYTPTYPTYSNALMNTSSWTMGWPWFQAKANIYWAGPFGAQQISGALYGIGITTNDAGTIAYRGGEFGTWQWQRFKIGINPDDTRVNNWFAPLQHDTWIPGASDGGCAAAGTTAVCFDTVSYYPGVETLLKQSVQVGRSTACATKPEYACTPFLHVTKVTPTSSPGNQVVTVSGSYYTPMKGDEIFEEYYSSHVRVFCKGAGDIPSRADSHTYSIGDFIIDPSGNLQRAKVGGVSAGSAPGAWGAAWGLPTAYQGAETTDGGVTWEYYGQACATSTSFSPVVDATDTDLNTAHGVPALWAGQASSGGSPSPAPIFYNWQAGTADTNTACNQTGFCESTVQPMVWIMMN